MEKKKVIAIIQARMGSTRLPGKVMMSLAGKPMLQHIIERVKRCKNIEFIVVATTSKKESNPIIEVAKKCKVEIFKGSENDVLDRFYRTALKFKADIIVRITADCPLISPDVVDKVILRYKQSKADYALSISRENNPFAYPRGINVEVFSFQVLKELNKLAKEQHHREHVTTYIEDNFSKYKIEWVEAEEELRRPQYRLTVDTKEDFKLVSSIYNNFSKNEFITLEQVIKFLDANPDIQNINLKIKQKEYGFLSKSKRQNTTICFRVDGSYELGLGHLSRCISLASELDKLGYKPIFISKKDSNVDAFVENKVPIIFLPDNVSKNECLYFIRSKVAEILPLAVIIDLKELNHDEYMALKQFSGLLIDINGENFSDFYSDIIIKGDVNSTCKNIAGVEYLLGTSYKILGEDIISYKKKNRKPNEKIKKILISMGGTDPNCLTLDIVRALINIKDADIDIVIGQFFSKEKELLKIIRNKNNFKLFKKPKDFKKMLVESDICFIAGGITLYEAIFLGTVPIVSCRNVTQLNDAKALENLGLCVCLGLNNQLSSESIKHTLNKLDFKSRSEIVAKGSSIIDGLGAKRVALFIYDKIKKTFNKKLLVVGAGIEQTQIIKTAQAMGCEVIAIDESINAVGFKFSDYSYAINTKNVVDINTIANKHEIDAIITSIETGVKTTSIIAKKNKLKGIDKYTADILTNKYKLKEVFKNHSIATPLSFIAHNFNETIKAIKNIGYPVILKPSDNAGARGVMKVNNFQDINNAYKYATENTKLDFIIVEEFLNGHELGCEALILNNKVKHIFLTDKIKTKPPYMVVMGHIMPANIPLKLHDNIEKLINNAVWAVGVNTGLVNFDIIISNKGPYIIDMGARLGGNYLPLLVYLSSGINTYKEAIKIALGLEPNFEKKQNNHSAIIYLEPEEGQVININNHQKILQNEGLILLDIKIKLGDYINKISHLSHRVGYFVVNAPNLDDLKKIITNVENNLNIITKR